MIVNFFEMIASAVFDVLKAIFGLLPQMPFGVQDLQAYLNDNMVVTVISWMNFFLPLQVAATIIALWAAAMTSYVGIKLAMKYSAKLG